MRHVLAGILLSLALPGLAHAQSTPGFTYGQVPTAGMWNNAFARKQDLLIYTPVNRAGDTMMGRFSTAPSTINGAGLTILPGIAPSAPNNGDVWATTTGFFGYVNNTTTQFASQSSVAAETSRAQAAEATKAPTASPTFTGTVTTPVLAITGTGSTGAADAFTATSPSGTVARSISARTTDMGRNVREFGAVCDGTTDNGPAFRAAFAAAKVVTYDLEGCASYYQINTTVGLPGGSVLNGPTDGKAVALGIRTTAAVDTFAVNGDQFGISNVRIQHDGSAGMAINMNSAQYGVVSHNAVIGSVAASTSPLMQMTGSLNTIDHNTFTNNRTNAYSVVIDAPGTTQPIINRIQSSNFGGNGKGISIGSTGGSARPEGIYLTNNHCFLKNVCLLVTSVDDLHSSSNTYDIGTSNQVVLSAGTLGIDLATFDGDYFSTLDTTVIPAVTRANAVCLQASGPISRLTIRSKFAYCGYGITSTDGNTSKLTIGSTFLNVTNIALNLQNVKGATISGNTCTSCTNNFIITDGAAGGPYILDDNQWDSTGAITLTQTTANNFRFGISNTGITLANFSAATTGSMAIASSTCVALLIPHGLSSTPNLDKTVLSPRVISGTMTNVSVSASAADATNITTQVCANVTAAGTVRVTANASL